MCDAKSVNDVEWKASVAYWLYKSNAFYAIRRSWARTLFIFEAFLAHGTLGRPVVCVVLHVIVEIGFFVEGLRAMRASTFFFSLENE